MTDKARAFLLTILVLSGILSSSKTHAQSNIDTNGTWISRGYGWVVEIDSKTIKMYDITKISCKASVEYPIEMLSEGLSVSDDVLSFKRGITIHTFDRISRLPELCTKKRSKKALKDPEYNFEVLWHTFNEQYVYFKERRVDWQKSYEKYRPRINNQTKKDELFATCYQMLEDLEDGHVRIGASEKIMKKAIAKTGYKNTPDADFKGLRRTIVSKYLKNYNTHNLSRTIWGKINEQVGYVQVNSMMVQGDYGITEGMTSKEAKKMYYKTLAKSPDQMENEINGMNKTMLKILSELGETEHLILDLRFNGGGKDVVGLAILSYFTPSARTIFTKKERIGDGYGPERVTELIPAAAQYQGKLHILQSHWSASATEILLLASLSIDNVERIGSPSEGIFSDILDKKLPNGWEFGLSNQVYQDNQGISYEAKGIPAHIDLNYSKDEHEFVEKLMEELESEGDKAIKTVLEEVDH